MAFSYVNVYVYLLERGLGNLYVLKITATVDRLLDIQTNNELSKETLPRVISCI